MKFVYCAAMMLLAGKLYGQASVVDAKGTLRRIDSSKWAWAGTSIYNKNSSGRVGINNVTPQNFLEVSGTAGSYTSGLRLTGLGLAVTDTARSRMLSVNDNGDVIVTANPGKTSWNMIGNNNATAASILGTTNDILMRIGSNNISILEFGRRQTLGLVQSYTDYTDPDQYLVHVKGNGGVSALQFDAANAGFYKPMFFTNTEGNFRLKGSAANTDFFELGSYGTNNNGSFNFTIGDDGDEPIIFSKYNYTTASNVEMMRLQGTGLNSDIRVGINVNGTPANSTFQSNGSMSLPVNTVTVNLTLNETHYTIVIPSGASPTITFPTAGTCRGRIYVIKNISGGNRSVSNYISLSGATANTIANGSSAVFQSDGTNWQRIM